MSNLAVVRKPLVSHSKPHIRKLSDKDNVRQRVFERHEFLPIKAALPATRGWRSFGAKHRRPASSPALAADEPRRRRQYLHLVPSGIHPITKEPSMLYGTLTLTENDWQRMNGAAQKYWPGVQLDRTSSRNECCRRLLLGGSDSLHAKPRDDQQQMVDSHACSLQPPADTHQRPQLPGAPISLRVALRPSEQKLFKPWVRMDAATISVAAPGARLRLCSSEPPTRVSTSYGLESIARTASSSLSAGKPNCVHGYIAAASFP